MHYELHAKRLVLLQMFATIHLKQLYQVLVALESACWVQSCLLPLTSYSQGNMLLNNNKKRDIIDGNRIKQKQETESKIWLDPNQLGGRPC